MRPSELLARTYSAPESRTGVCGRPRRQRSASLTGREGEIIGVELGSLTRSSAGSHGGRGGGPGSPWPSWRAPRADDGGRGDRMEGQGARLGRGFRYGLRRRRRIASQESPSRLARLPQGQLPLPEVHVHLRHLSQPGQVSNLRAHVPRRGHHRRRRYRLPLRRYGRDDG